MGKAEDVVRARMAQRDAERVLLEEEAQRQKEADAAMKLQRKESLENLIKTIIPPVLEDLEKHGFPGGEIQQFGIHKHFLCFKYNRAGQKRVCWPLSSRSDIYLSSTGKLAWRVQGRYFWGALNPNYETLCIAFKGLRKLAPEAVDKLTLESGLLEDSTLRYDLDCAGLYSASKTKINP